MDHFAGYKFHLSEIELVNSYLQPKVYNQPLLYPGIIHEVNFYDNGPNWLSENFPAQGVNKQGDQEWYFFTPIYKKHPNGKRPTRIAGDGFWRGVTGESAIKGANKATTRTLVYNYKKDGTNVKTNWIMKEYFINHESHQTINDNTKLYDWVLCLMYRSNHSIRISEALSNAKRKKSENLIIAKKDDDQRNAKRLRPSPLMDQSSHLGEVHPPLMIEPPPVQSSLPPFEVTEEYLATEAQQLGAQFNVIFESTSIDTYPVDVLVDAEPIQGQQPQMENLQNYYQDYLMNFDDDYVDAQTIENLLPPMMNSFQQILNSDDDVDTSYNHTQFIEHRLPPMENQDHAQMMESQQPPMENQQPLIENELQLMEYPQTLIENELPLLENQQAEMDNEEFNIVFDNLDGNTQQNQQPPMENQQVPFERLRASPLMDQSTHLGEVHPPLIIEPPPVQSSLLPFEATKEYLHTEAQQQLAAQFYVIFVGTSNDTSPVEVLVDAEPIQNQQPPIENLQNNYQDYLKNFDGDHVDAQTIENLLPPMENLQNYYQDCVKNFDDDYVDAQINKNVLQAIMKSFQQLLNSDDDVDASYNHTQSMEHQLPPMENQDHTQMMENQKPQMENQQPLIENELPLMEYQQALSENELPPLENQQAAMENEEFVMRFDDLDGNTQQNRQPTMQNQQAPRQNEEFIIEFDDLDENTVWLW